MGVFWSPGFRERASESGNHLKTREAPARCQSETCGRSETGKMPQKQAKNAALSLDTPTKEQAGVDLRQNRTALFIQQFNKEAQERVNEMEAKIENMLATVDKVFRVELMKMPPSLQNTRVGDILNDSSASDVSIAMHTESHEIHQPLKRVPSRKVKLPDNAHGQQLIGAQKPPAKHTKGGKGLKRNKTFAGCNSTGSLRCSTANVKSESRLDKSSNRATAKPKLRTLSSAGDLSCSVARCAPHVTITTSGGQTFCLSEETKDDIDLDLLDDVAFCQIQRLMRLMDYLASKAKVSSDE